MKIKKSIRGIACITTILMLSSCGGGGGSSSTTAVAKTEIINGFTVPVAPDNAANAATIKGVDSNNNGVRDDIERKIAEKSSSTDSFNKAILSGQSYQAMILAPENITRDDAIKILKIELCSKLPGNIDRALMPGADDSIIDQTVNSPERQEQLSKFDIVVGGVMGSEMSCD